MFFREVLYNDDIVKILIFGDMGDLGGVVMIFTSCHYRQ